GYSFMKKIQRELQDNKYSNVFYGSEANALTYQRNTYAFIRNANYALDKRARGPKNVHGVFDSSITDHMAYEELRHVQLAKSRDWLKVDSQLHLTIEEALIKMDLFNKRGPLHMDRDAQREVQGDYQYYIDEAR